MSLLTPMRLALLRPSGRAFSTSLASSQQIASLTVFGAGLMGAGIVQVAAQHGIKVKMADVSDKALENGRKIIEKSLGRVLKKMYPEDEAKRKEVLEGTWSRVKCTTDVKEAVKGSDLVIEAIVENIATKQDLFKRLDEVANQDTIFASNTSSLSIQAIASSSSEGRQKRFAGFHAFNPVPQMKLVEIIQTEKTNQETIDALLELCKVMKKTPVQCADKPGFIVNRLLVPYMLEAVRMIERGDASAKDVDTAMKLGAGLPMGPLELSDFVGLDTLSAIARGWRETRVSTGEIDKLQVAEVGMLEELVKAGKKGRKSGEGFFKYE